jgi:hypothetical protein
MADNNSSKASNQFSNILKSVGGKFKKDFFKYSLLTIWIITIVFLLIINLFVIFNIEGTYGENLLDAFKAFDLTKVILEMIISIPVIFAVIFIFAKRGIGHRIGIITSSIIIFESVFLNVFYNMYNAFAADSANVFDPQAGWNTFKHWTLGILHIIVIIMILIDMKKSKNNTEQMEETIEPPKQKKKVPEKEEIPEKIEEKNQQSKNDKNEKENTSTETKSKKEDVPAETEEETKSKKESTEEQDETAGSTNGSSLSTEDLEALNELSNMDVTDTDKEKDEEELKNLQKGEQEEDKDKDK